MSNQSGVPFKFPEGIFTQCKLWEDTFIKRRQTKRSTFCLHRGSWTGENIQTF